ncbi:MAG: hypothetical protein LBT40_15315 [Deltaproteobacteria bacterium]|nr:hypothetical protein [Deltaproteobacteria bacterium]
MADAGVRKERLAGRMVLAEGEGVRIAWPEGGSWQKERGKEPWPEGGSWQKERGKDPWPEGGS